MTKKKISAFIMAILLGISLTGLFLALDFNLGFSNERSLMKSVNQSGYSEGAYKQLTKDISNMIKDHGMEKVEATILKGVIDREKFRLDSASSIKKALKGQALEIDSSKERIALEKNIRLYLADENITVTNNLKTAITELVNTAGSYYETHAGFTFGIYYKDFEKTTRQATKVLIPVALILSLIFSFSIVKLRHYKHRAVRTISYSILGASVLNLVAVGFIYNYSKNLIVEASTYYMEFIKIYIKNSVVPALVVSALGAIVFLSLLMLVKYLKERI